MNRRTFLQTLSGLAVAVGSARVTPSPEPMPLWKNVYRPSAKQVAFFDHADHAVDAWRYLTRYQPIGRVRMT